jgi:EAL domain-containing protein (putative c-di-GMP-specific phosphodiesterase class I)
MSIDDFGTGYSSLSYLKRFPIGKLKIDRSFVDGLPADDSDAAIVRAIVDLGHALRLDVIAEGVETVAQRDFLVQAGCDEYQGFLCSRALPAEAFVTLYQKRLAGEAPV